MRKVFLRMLYLSEYGHFLVGENKTVSEKWKDGLKDKRKDKKKRR